MARHSEIKLIDPTTKDIARPFNFAMVKSKKTANLITGKLNLYGPVRPYHVANKIYPNDTFTKSGLLKPEGQMALANDIKKILKSPKDIQEFNMMDFANAIIKSITKKF